MSRKTPAGGSTAGASKLRVLIADDHPLMIVGIRNSLERDEAIEIVGEARSGPELVHMVGRRQPQLVLMDLRMPGVTGTDCIEQVLAASPGAKIVVLSAHQD